MQYRPIIPKIMCAPPPPHCLSLMVSTMEQAWAQLLQSRALGSIPLHEFVVERQRHVCHSLYVVHMQNETI